MPRVKNLFPDDFCISYEVPGDFKLQLRTKQIDPISLDIILRDPLVRTECDPFVVPVIVR